jgi:hypothetical protein
MNNPLDCRSKVAPVSGAASGAHVLVDRIEGLTELLAAVRDFR